MKKLLALTVLALLALTGTAQAHTGSVACTDKGVTFTYVSFANATAAKPNLITEKVGSVTSTFSFTGTSGSHTVPNTAASVVVSASWNTNGHVGSISPRTLTCPVVCVPTVVEKIVYKDRIVYVDRPVEVIKYVDKVVEKIVYVERIVEKLVEVPGPTQTVTVAVPGLTVTQYVTKWKTKIVNRVKVKYKVKYKFIPYKPVVQPTHPRGGGVNG